jgi:hypothetical protein
MIREKLAVTQGSTIVMLALIVNQQKLRGHLFILYSYMLQIFLSNQPRMESRFVGLSTQITHA